MKMTSDCKCTDKRKIKVMDFDQTAGLCLKCYGKVDLSEDGIEASITRRRTPDPCGGFNNKLSKHKKFFKEPLRNIKKVCTGCRKSYQPIMADDGDCCPSCARY